VILLLLLLLLVLLLLQLGGSSKLGGVGSTDSDSSGVPQGALGDTAALQVRPAAGTPPPPAAAAATLFKVALLQWLWQQWQLSCCWVPVSQPFGRHGLADNLHTAVTL